MKKHCIFKNLPEGKIYVEKIEVTSESEYVLIFLHEGLGSIAQWKDFPELLCRMTGINGFLYDRFGYGKSDLISGKREINYIREEAFNYLPAIISAEKLNEKKIILVGHSDGGAIGLLFASTQPENLRCLISIAAHTFIEDTSVNGIRKAVEYYEKGELKEKLKKYHGEKTDTLFYNWSGLWLNKESHTWNMINDLKSINYPVLVIQGDSDEYGTEKQADIINQNVNGFSKKEIIFNCGHLPHIQARDYTAALIINFLYDIGLEFKTE